MHIWQNNIEQYIRLYIANKGNKITEEHITEQFVKLQDVVVLICGTISYSNMVIDTCQECGKEYYVF